MKVKLVVITAQGKVLRAKVSEDSQVGFDGKPMGTLSLDHLLPAPLKQVLDANGIGVKCKKGYVPGTKVPNMVPLLDHPPFMGLKAGDKFTIEIVKD